MKLVKKTAILLLLFAISVSLISCNNNNNGEKSFQFEYRNDCEALTCLTTYVATVTDEKSADYIPTQDRIAVFDMDGTLVCEEGFI